MSTGTAQEKGKGAVEVVLSHNSAKKGNRIDRAKIRTT